MKIAFSSAILNGNNTYEETLKTIYPYASQIVIAEGPVSWWQKEGYTTSIDGTNEMIDNFPDPDNKIRIVHGKYPEKLEQTNAYIDLVNDDIDYLWTISSDIVFKSEDIEKMIRILKKHKKTYTLVRFKSLTFFGGFDDYLTGFEERVNFPGIWRIYPGTRWKTHRYPKLVHKQKPLPGKILEPEAHGIRMYHYSYVFADHVYQKARYYNEFLGAQAMAKKGRNPIIDNWFKMVWLPWVRGNDKQRKVIEKKYRGVHEFKPWYRKDCYTAKFDSKHPAYPHPKIIQDNMGKLKKKINQQLRKY